MVYIMHCTPPLRVSHRMNFVGKAVMRKNAEVRDNALATMFSLLSHVKAQTHSQFKHLVAIRKTKSRKLRQTSEQIILTAKFQFPNYMNMADSH